jgi:hypothetical protein
LGKLQDRRKRNNIMRNWQDALKEYLEKYFADDFAK